MAVTKGFFPTDPNGRRPEVEITETLADAMFRVTGFEGETSLGLFGIEDSDGENKK
jgi:hypothetical protein